jgi:ketosteroid isomerase-like protein
VREASEQERAELAAWFRQLASCIEATDYDRAVNLYGEGVFFQFGAVHPVLMEGVQETQHKQWSLVWPHVERTRYDTEAMRALVSDGGDLVVVAIGYVGAGRGFESFGRASYLFERAGGSWRPVHAHYSVQPAY